MSLGYAVFNRTGDNASAPNAALLNFTGDRTIIACIRSTVFNDGTGVIQKWNTGSNERQFHCGLSVGASGPTPYYYYSSNGTNEVGGGGSEITGFSDGDYIWVRWDHDVSTGQVNYYYHGTAPINTVDPLTITGWTGASSDTYTPANVYGGTSPDSLYIAESPFTNLRGDVYGVWLYEGLFGSSPTRRANPDWRTGAQGWFYPPGTDDEGNVWTFNSDTYWVRGGYDPRLYSGGRLMGNRLASAHTASVVI